MFAACEKTEQVCKCFIGLTNLGTIHGEVLPNCFLPKQIIKVEAFFNGDMPSNNTQPTKTDHKTHTNQLTVIE